MSKLRHLWLRWKMLRLPWRKTFLVGQDLAGNTFWEFKDALRSNRFRRRMRPNGKTYLSDIQVSPLWHQWLRYTRANPPTLQEQTDDVARQVQLKHNAQLADARWARKAPYIASPAQQPEREHQPAPAQTQPSTKRPVQTQPSTQRPAQTPSNPGADFQPAAWVPGAKAR